MRGSLIGVVVLIALVAVALLAPAPGNTKLATTPSPTPTVKAPVTKPKPKPTCSYTMRAIRKHRTSVWVSQKKLGITPTRASATKIVGCAWAHKVEHLWWERSIKWKKLVRKRLIPTSPDWITSVKLVQKAFPGTESWLLSCSGAEGGHSRWVIYGGHPYYPGAEYSKTFWGWMVGGPMQYMWPTFKGHYRHGLDSIKERGYVVDLPAVEDVAAWRSMTAQAVAAGWARWSGNDGSHWAASSSNGC